MHRKPRDEVREVGQGAARMEPFRPLGGEALPLLTLSSSKSNGKLPPFPSSLPYIIKMGKNKTLLLRFLELEEYNKAPAQQGSLGLFMAKGEKSKKRQTRRLGVK